MDIVDKIRLRQAYKYGSNHLQASLPPELPSKNVESLVIGCMEPKLDPIKHMGFPLGGAFIVRHGSGFVNGLDANGHAANPAEASAIELAVKVKKVKHIFVAAHTGCTALNTCMHDYQSSTDLPFTRNFLHPLDALRDAIRTQFPGDEHAAMHAMEEEIVKKSVQNLMTYPFVREAVEIGDLQLHGWVMDIHTKQIKEMDAQTQQFEWMATRYKDALTAPEGQSWLKSMRTQLREIRP